MQIAKEKVALIDYTLKNDSGEVIDTSDGREPLGYIHGIGALIPGLEEELEGKQAGDKVDVKVAPDKGYGQRNEQLIHTVNKSQFDGIEELEVGMQLQAQTNEGVQIIRITAIDGDNVTVDANHPLAGETLHFSVEVKEVREASAEEIAHGHVHGPGGHQH